ncbi:hypothetical protein [Streptomyces rhizosphaericus]|uniref:hypothetical protein n=1 Tax=Streptomyces rhizosphaericus TaxID=114699 RepID=UPI0011808DCB|nr:hypothetical protein [Streptomyces rhizosphaericus]
MALTFELTNRINWIALSRSTIPQSADGSQLPPFVQEAMDGLAEMIKRVMVQADEVHLITESAQVNSATSEYVQALVSFNPSATGTNAAGALEQGTGLVPRLLAGHRRFTIAARQELGMQSQLGEDP